MKHVIVIGAGASGLMAAICAARAGARVTVLEATEKPAKKLLMTGNGRCNLTNLDFSRSDCYRGDHTDFARLVLEQFDNQKTMSFFKDMGLLLQEKNGGIYPLTDQASSVADRLLLTLQKEKIKLKCLEKAERIEKKDHLWTVYTKTWHYEADAVILSCGGKAVPSSGSDGSGYTLAAMAGHTVHMPFPALVPLKCRESFVKKLSGLRTKAIITMEIRNKDQELEQSYSEKGELQWTDYGVSGIVIFQLSRYAAKALQQKRTVNIHIDCLPSVSETMLFEMLRERLGKESISDALTGILPKKMIPVILELALQKHTSIKPDDKQLHMLCRRIKDLTLSVCGTKSFDAAQVCAGGVATDEIHPETMESRLKSGLYLTGELLDIDGICGGYNLQWAWSTGYLAGISSAQKGERYA